MPAAMGSVRCRMLRFAARYGLSVDRTLALTAARLSAGRLLSPPSNLSYSRRSRWHPTTSAVHLDAHVLPEPTAEPRRTLDLEPPPGPQRRRARKPAAAPGRDLPEEPEERLHLRDPRTPPVQARDMEPLAPEFIGDQSRTLQLRREMVLEAHPSVISTCAPPTCTQPSAARAPSAQEWHRACPCHRPRVRLARR